MEDLEDQDEEEFEDEQEIEEFNNIKGLSKNKGKIMEIFFKRVDRMSEMVDKLNLQH